MRMMPPGFPWDRYLVRVKAMQAPLLVLADRMVKSDHPWVKVLGLRVFHLDAWWWWLSRP